MNDFHATLTSLVSHLEFFQDYKLIFLVFVLSVFLTNQNQEFSRRGSATLGILPTSLARGVSASW